MASHDVRTRLEAVSQELSELVSECMDSPVRVEGTGKLSMANFFARQALEAMTARPVIPRGGLDRSLPGGDR
ncbi:MAG: hypothetical protein KUA35_09210 [Pseudodesulfovibrio sp.]|uniref:Uncharacterized protein n=1 Tax=Pseudodesulfovibrio aespoeensis (strain ATCC 700646 / DSM 10631 / Aspo-2) TaxID=643562 RepID=E6VX47_PSEA9|nr:MULTISPECIES: hypothetical protein [Pseudodesulfovibrio]MBU4379789.1 hypothetical protein [Pseudomonadota bacterium]ADU61453.1 hypothetical protein Daes_0429 [Pseudodesulfovibrio aespoeensis Aspo-2]MBU4475247.1 hypothetical protein [Pseudomonadota bacterium]MBU4516286.1 hypothetical protein [Pseudomonadota bacterium]MBU4522465.1 hypothetical protein [Pseudomonadota bacterium]